MLKKNKNKPHHPLSQIKAIAKTKNFRLAGKAPQTLIDLQWDTNDVQDCLLKLNDKLWELDKLKNHYHKTEQHRDYPPPEKTFMDYYRAHKIHCGESVYTHFYIREKTTNLIINSFKAL